MNTVKKQKREEGEAIVSTVLFDNVSEVVHDRVDIQKIEPMTRKEYYVRGCTALLDAVGGAIHHIGNVHKYARKEDVPEKTMFIITTDGYENASTEYNAQQIHQLIGRLKEQEGWNFAFMGANQDVTKVCIDLNIDVQNAQAWEFSAEGTRHAFDAYIFLSYRKKDRRYANELMRLIHNNPECRDIAIWFDEFFL